MNSNLKREIEPDTIFLRNSDQLFSEVDSEIIMLNIANEEYYYLDEVGSEIWKFIGTPRSFREIISALVETYDVKEDLCISDTKSYLEELILKGLIFREDE